MRPTLAQTEQTMIGFPDLYEAEKAGRAAAIKRAEQAESERDALRAQVEAMRWQPIETAPRDETWFLGYVPGRGVFECAFLPSGIGVYTYYRRIDGGYECRNAVVPTLWLLIPAIDAVMREQQT